MTVTGSLLRLAGATLLVVAVAGCGGIDRTSRGDEAGGAAGGESDRAADAEGSLGNLLDGDAASDEDLAAEVDAWLADPGLDALDAADTEQPGTASPGAGPGGSGEPSAGDANTPGPATTPTPASTPAPLPAFEAGSFADLDAALSTLDFALAAGESGSEGNLP